MRYESLAGTSLAREHGWHDQTSLPSDPNDRGCLSRAVLYFGGTGGIHYPDSWVVNFGSVALCLLVAAGFFIDFSYTKRRFKKGTPRENRGKGV